jgi:hypothetical protein
MAPKWGCDTAGDAVILSLDRIILFLRSFDIYYLALNTILHNKTVLVKSISMDAYEL